MKDYLIGGPIMGFYGFASIRLIGIFTNGYNWLALPFDLVLVLIAFVGQFFYVRRLRQHRELIRELRQGLRRDLQKNQ